MKDNREAKPYRADVRAAGRAKAEDQVIATFNGECIEKSVHSLFCISPTLQTCQASLTRPNRQTG